MQKSHAQAGVRTGPEGSVRQAAPLCRPRVLPVVALKGKRVLNNQCETICNASWLNLFSRGV